MRRLSLIALVALAACSEAQPEPAAKALTEAPTAPAVIPDATRGFAEGVRIAWANGQAVTPEETIQLVGLNGPEGALVGLEAGQPGSRWTTVLAGIASGEPAWLNVAAALEPGVSGERAEELDTALKAALATDPAATLRVLEVARQRMSPAVVCGGDTRVKSLLRPAVQTVTDPALEAKRTACLEALG
ncbi:hypothetical protein [Brevundimonas bacteroides]|uniref:hypothetical protein n=1 Tax=Brevundimonas bacteroides TaxID=74311 RepID=UPI000497D5C9|nr:hypothetical protein [Brevundimonas bacteroides]